MKESSSSHMTHVLHRIYGRGARNIYYVAYFMSSVHNSLENASLAKETKMQHDVHHHAVRIHRQYKQFNPQGYPYEAG